MPPRVSGKQKRPPAAKKRKKSGTTSTKLHSFESFNDRIAKLSVKPITRARRQDIDADDADATTSHFRRSLEKWRELNLSEHFGAFVRDVDPLCDSLPQILHYQERIVDMLLNFLSVGNPLSLEPLLDLTSALAHDLGPRFEQYFARALTVICDLAQTRMEVETLEWSFAALAWMFKYLSRLLVPDLRPTFEIMAPLLGRSQHKPHIARFAADAMAFLIRKAATTYHKDPEPLKILIVYILGSFEALEEKGELSITFEYGVMTLFAGAIKGVDRQLHSCGSIIFDKLIEHVSGVAGNRVALGTFVNILHHSNSSNALPLLESVRNLVVSSTGGTNGHTKVLLGSALIFHAATLRNGSRVANWNPLIQSIRYLRAEVDLSDISLGPEVEKADVAVLSQAPLSEVLPEARLFMETLMNKRCETFSTMILGFLLELNPERFASCVSPYIHSYIEKRSSSRENESLYFLVQLAASSASPVRSGRSPNGLMMPHDWMRTILTPSIDKDEVYSCLQIYQQNACLEIKCLSCINQLLENIAQRLLDSLSKGFSGSMNSRLLLGKGLQLILETNDLNFSDLTPLTSSKLAQSTAPIYLTNMTAIGKLGKLRLNHPDCEGLAQDAIKNLQSPSKDLRLASLYFIKEFCGLRLDGDTSVVELALSIEDVPFDFQAARKISLYTSQLPPQHMRVSKDPWLQQVAPHFLFGLLTHQITDVWPLAIDALKVICNEKEGEYMVSSLALEWLKMPEVVDQHEHPRSIHHSDKDDEDGSIFAAEFQCNNSEALKRLWKRIHEEYSQPEDRLQEIFEKIHRKEIITHQSARLQCLRLLKSIPWLIEKKSRQFVPLFLQWMVGEVDPCLNGEQPGVQIAAASRQERLFILDILAATQNPRGLYRSPEIYTALLNILKSSEAEFQKRAFKAILTWKHALVRSHEEVLNTILDEDRFREGIFELSKNLQAEGQKPQQQQELMAIVLRILFGRMTASSKHSNVSTQRSKQHAILDALARFDDMVLKDFLEIALGNTALSTFETAADPSGATSLLKMPPRAKLGLLNFIKEMVRAYGDRLKFLVLPIANIALICSEQAGVTPPDNATDLKNQTLQSVSSNIHLAALKAIISMFEHLMSPLLSDIVARVHHIFIYPRIDRFAEENSQSISSLLRLFSSWASDVQTQHFLAWSDQTLTKVVDILSNPSAKEDVLMFILEKILLPVFSSSLMARSPINSPNTDVLKPHLDHILRCCHRLLLEEPSKLIQNATIEVVTSVASLNSQSTQAMNLLRISCSLLEQPPTRVSPKTKSGLLGIVRKLIPKVDLSNEADLQDQVFEIISQLFSYFKDRENRLSLCEGLNLLALQDFEVQKASSYCADLNAYSGSTIDEPDFDRRRQAYENLVELGACDLSAKQWTPILHNLIFFMKETDELGAGSNACFALCAVIKQARKDPVLVSLLLSVVLPALQKGAFDKSEDVRREFLKAMATLVKEHAALEEVKDLTVLLMQNDEEASIFNNILHIQHHRRIRALRRLATPQICASLRSTNVAFFLIPLLEHFVIDREDETKAPELATETINTIGALASALEWQHIRLLFSKYLRFVATKPNLEKSTMKLLGALVDSVVVAASGKDSSDNEPIYMNEHDHQLNSNDQVSSLAVQSSTLTKSISTNEANLQHEITQKLLPPLVAFLHHKDEAVMSIRVPVAISAVKLVMLLPKEKISVHLAPILTNVSHLMRSRMSDSRDLCRKTLAEIARVIGAPYFGFILKELRGALQRGYQLHVLSFTMHTLLVEAGPSFVNGALDHCATNAVAIIMDDIFGVVGMEKDADDYFSKMKEVKQHKSFDSMEILAKIISLDHLNVLVRPIQALLREKLDLRTTKKVDELLRRISAGVLKNKSAEDRKLLVFCYELIQRAYASEQDSTKKNIDAVTRRFLINIRGAKANQIETSSFFGFKTIRFAFELLRSAFQKFDSLRTPANISGFLPAIGDAILQGEEEVQMAGIRLLASIMRIPLKALDADAPAYISAAVEAIKNTVSNDTEMAQAALKLIATTLRERPDIEIQETDVAFLLKRLRPDLDRFENLGFVFNLLKSVVGRNIVIPEVYEFMDAVAAMMITNQSKEARGMAQASYFQFLLNYPQGPRRFAKQLSFLRKNLDYPHAEGRKSVLEAIHRLLSRVDEELSEDVIGSFFEPLVLMIINDENGDCRKLAGLLLGNCIEKAGMQQASRIYDQTRRWLDQEENHLLNRAAFQIYIIWIEKDANKLEQILPSLCDRISEVVEKTVLQDQGESWELLYSSLQLLSKVTARFPSLILNERSKKLWELVQQCAVYPHSWIKHISASLLGKYLEHFVYESKSLPLLFPLGSPNGLKLELNDVYALTKRSLRPLQLPGITVDLAEQVVRNLATLAKLSESQPSESSSFLMEPQENDSDDESVVEDERHTKSILMLIFERLSWIIRSDPVSSKATALISKTAALKLCRVLCNNSLVDALKPLFPTIMLPIQQLTDVSVPVPFTPDEEFKRAWKENVSIAHDIIDILQERLGSGNYMRQMSDLQAKVKSKREERRQKRRIESITAPEKILKDKRRKHDRTRERRKERNSLYRQHRHG